jgi:hypothetical protein
MNSYFLSRVEGNIPTPDREKISKLNHKILKQPARSWCFESWEGSVKKTK